MLSLAGAIVFCAIAAQQAQRDTVGIRRVVMIGVPLSLCIGAAVKFADGGW